MHMQCLILLYMEGEMNGLGYLRVAALGIPTMLLCLHSLFLGRTVCINLLRSFPPLTVFSLAGPLLSKTLHERNRIKHNLQRSNDSPPDIRYDFPQVSGWPPVLSIFVRKPITCRKTLFSND